MGVCGQLSSAPTSIHEYGTVLVLNTHQVRGLLNISSDKATLVRLGMSTTR